MPLLPPNVSYRPDNTPLFVTTVAPVQGTIVASAFTATGEGQPGADGRFVARGDASGGSPALAFQMRTGGVSALQQWNIGMTEVPAGANSGNNFAILAYDDASNLLSIPLAINRATGAIELGSEVTVGDGAEVTGAVLQVNGDDGLSRVYDSIYNRPNAGAEFIMMTTDNLLNQTVVQNVTPTYSGLYVLTMEVQASATGLAFTNGTSIINGYLFTAGPGGYITDSYLCCDFVANPTGYNTPGPTIPPNTYVKDSVAIVNLQAGVTYSAGVYGSAGINLGTSGAINGGIRMFIQPLLA